MSDANYYDLLKGYDTSRYFSYLNDSYIKLSGVPIKVFKLDKKATVLDDVYGTERHSRIYLPPFEIRSLYLTNPWQGMLGLGPYEEEEQNIKFVVNFDNMVHVIRDLRNKHLSEIRVEALSTSTNVAARKNEGNLELYINNSLTYSIPLSTYRTTKTLVNYINSFGTFKASLTGINDDCSKIPDFPLINFKGSSLMFYTIDTTYSNITDVIEMGDVVLTEKWRAYEIKSAAPGGDSGWNWTTYSMEANLVELDILDGLPGDYRKMIEKHQYGMGKISEE